MRSVAASKAAICWFMRDAPKRTGRSKTLCSARTSSFSMRPFFPTNIRGAAHRLKGLFHQPRNAQSAPVLYLSNNVPFCFLQ